LSDPGDEGYLATAVAGGAEALVTGNRRHFVLDRYDAVEILSPRAFLDRTA
jgi:predicted nucleic acid-binding protein